MFFCGHDGTITIQEQDPADHDARLGSQLGDYVVVARVADGAMGRVYEGRHLETKGAQKVWSSQRCLEPVVMDASVVEALCDQKKTKFAFE